MKPLVHQRCFSHPDREAAVRCPECQRYYCRECVTEHLDRMMCAHCVARSAAVATGSGFSSAKWGALSAGGFLFAWALFYYLGMGLARMPASFHGGTP